MLLLLACLVGLEPSWAEAPSATLQPGDLVHVNVYRHPELSASTRVDSAGNVSLPYIGNVKVDGISEAEASSRVTSAFGAILKSPRVTVSRGGGGLPMMQGSRTEAMITQIVKLQNARAENLSRALESMTSQGGSINYDEDTNSLILTDTPAALQNMVSVVNELDLMQDQVTQVHIEAKIAEVEGTAIKEVGVRWFTQGDQVAGGYNPGPRQDTRVSSTRGVNDPLFNERIDTGRSLNDTASRRFIDEARFDRRLQIPVQVAAPGQMFFGFFNSGIDLGVMLDALAANNKAELLAAPYIRTVNNKPAQIKMTQEYPFTEVGSAGLATISSTRFIDIGIILDVTPRVKTDPQGQRYVQLELKPEVSTATGVANGVPVRSVRSSESTANVRDGQTLVIGGIVQDDARDVLQKVPGIGSLPLIGTLFRHKEKSKANRELMIFVTPTVYDRPESATWDRAMQLNSVSPGSDIKSRLESRAETRKD